MRDPRLALVALALAAAACRNDFVPRSVLLDVRVLGVEGTDPTGGGPRTDLVAGAGESIRLVPYRLLPPVRGDAPAWVYDAEAWTFCPLSFGAQVGYACAVHTPECERTLATVSGAQVPADGWGTAATLPGSIDQVLQECIASLQSSGGSLPVDPNDLPSKIDLVFTYAVTAHTGTEAPFTRTAVQTVPLYLKPPTDDRNLPPLPACVLIDGQPVDPVCLPQGQAAPVPTLPAGGRIPVVVQLTHASEQEYTDSAGQRLPETLVLSFFTTDGRFNYDRSYVAEDARGDWAGGVDLKDDGIVDRTQPLAIWVVASDLRGGETVLGPYQVAIGAR